MPEAMSKCRPESIPDWQTNARNTVRIKARKYVSVRITDRMPERMSDRMLEYMPYTPPHDGKRCQNGVPKWRSLKITKIVGFISELNVN